MKDVKLTKAQERLLRSHRSIYRWRKWYGNPSDDAQSMHDAGLIEVMDDEGGGSVMWSRLSDAGRAYLAAHPEEPE